MRIIYWAKAPLDTSHTHCEWSPFMKTEKAAVMMWKKGGNAATAM
jgi:hypothetical protein